MSPEKTKKRKPSVFNRILNGIERVGNKLPHPITLFGIFALAIILISALCSWLGVSATGELIDSHTLETTTQTVTAVSLLSRDGIVYMLTNLIGNFTSFAPLGVVVVLVLLSGLWKSQVAFTIAGAEVGLPGIVRDVGLIIVALVSLRITPKQVHEDNQFSWGPMQEVAKLFAGIFLTIIPVIAMLKAGVNGPFGAVVSAVTRPDGTPDPAMYFWASGLLSSFLDNAPTYLVFFNTAGGDPAVLMTTLAPTLAAISAGSVFMGANSYIGNAPNMMVKAIAEDRGVKMPSFFGYMLWSGGILVPLFIVMTFIWFR